MSEGTDGGYSALGRTASQKFYTCLYCSILCTYAQAYIFYRWKLPHKECSRKLLPAGKVQYSCNLPQKQAKNDSRRQIRQKRKAISSVGLMHQPPQAPCSGKQKRPYKAGKAEGRPKTEPAGGGQLDVRASESAGTQQCGGKERQGQQQGSGHSNKEGFRRLRQGSRKSNHENGTHISVRHLTKPVIFKCRFCNYPKKKKEQHGSFPIRPACKKQDSRAAQTLRIEWSW